MSALHKESSVDCLRAVMVSGLNKISAAFSRKALVAFFSIISLTFGACADGNLTSTVRVVRDKQIQVPFPPRFSIPPVVEYMQFLHLDWSATTGEIAASAIQGFYVHLVNPDTGVTRSINVVEYASGRHLAWLPNTTLLVIKGSLLDRYGNVQVYDMAGDTTKPALNRFMSLPTTLKGITLPDGKPAFVALGEPKPSSVENGVKYYAYIHAGPDWSPVQKVQVFPNDGTTYHIQQATVRQTPNGIYAAIHAHQVIRPGGARLPDGSWQTSISQEDAFIVNLSTGKTLCQIDVYEGDPTTDGRSSSASYGIALSASARWIALSTGKMFDFYDVKTCKRIYRLAGKDFDPRGAGFIAPVFTADEKYLILAGSDVRTREGGYLNVWRVGDGKLIYHDEELRPQALTVDPKSNRFVIGHDQGQLTLFHIED